MFRPAFGPVSRRVFRVCPDNPSGQDCGHHFPARPEGVPKVGDNCMNVTFADLFRYIFAKNDYICEINEKN